MSFRASKATTLPCRAPRSLRSTSGAVDAGDDMRVRDDETGSHDPARALDPEAAGDPADAHDRGARTPHLRVARDRGLRRLDAGRRPDERRERVDPPDGVHDPLRRQRVGERRDDDRLLREPPELGLTRDVEERRRRPTSRSRARSPRRGAMPPAESSSRSGGTTDSELLAERPASIPSVCPITPPTPAPPSATSGTYGLAVADEPGCESRAGDRADDEPRQRKEPRHEPAP